MSLKMGYCRVSAKDQNLERQLIKFKKLGIEERYIFADMASGKNFNRPRYQAMREQIREGDLIYVDSLDRLGRDYDLILKEWKYITLELKADIVCLDNEQLFDSRNFRKMGDIGKMLQDQLLSTLAYVADVERKKNRQRQREGIDLAQANGVKFGRPTRKIGTEFKKIYELWKAEKITAVEAYTRLQLPRTTFYRKVSDYESEIANEKIKKNKK